MKIKRKKILIVPQTGVFRLFNRKLILLAGLIALAFCLAFTACEIPEENDVTGITLDYTTLTLAEGDSGYINIASVQPAGATYETILWTTSDPTAVTVKDGKITALPSSAPKTGVVITAKTGTASATCTVSVVTQPNIQVNGVTLNKNDITLTKTDFVTITANVLPSNAGTKTVFWISDDPSVAKVDKNGKVTAVSEGFATITVYTQNKGKTASCDVEVVGSSIPVDGVTLTPATLALIVGGTETLTPVIQPTDATNQNVTWSTSNASVATVTNGEVTAITAGTATITVTTADGNKTAQCAVTVTATGVSVASVSLSKTSLSLVKDKAGLLIATVLPTNATNRAVTWSSSDPTVAAVTEGMVSAIKAGTATITVTATGDATKTATCTVTVSDPTNQAAYYGKYTGKYTNSSNKVIAETVELSSNRVYIYDDEKSGTDLEFLDFSVTKWETAVTPDSQKDDYPIAFKITGTIKDAKPADAGILYGNVTAAGFTLSDLNTTECWMYIYISSDGKFIRSPFSKASKNNGTAPVSTNNKFRIYSKVL